MFNRTIKGSAFVHKHQEWLPVFCIMEKKYGAGDFVSFGVVLPGGVHL
jgi:hypothetical protein